MKTKTRECTLLVVLNQITAVDTYVTEKENILMKRNLFMCVQITY